MAFQLVNCSGMGELALIRHGLIVPGRRKRRREDYRRWERGRAMQLWQMDVMGRVHLAGGQEVKIVTGIDDHSRFIVCAKAVLRATARPVCLALTETLHRHGVPEQILTDNGKVFTARFGLGPGPVMSGPDLRRQRHPAPAHQAVLADHDGQGSAASRTMRAEFFTPNDKLFATVEELQAALDRWVTE